MVPEHLYPDTMKAHWFDEVDVTGVTFEKVEHDEEVEDNE